MVVVRLDLYRSSQADTIRAIQEILTEALKPNGATGLVAILQRPGRDYSVIIAGAPQSDAVEAVFMSGMCEVLKSDLEAIIRGE